MLRCQQLPSTTTVSNFNQSATKEKNKIQGGTILKTGTDSV